jgi:DNA polymerase-3 subunit delta
MTFNEIMAGLEKGSYRPLYLLYGEEPYYIDRISGYIIANVLNEAEKAFNQTIVYGKDCDAGQVTGMARRYPMMAPRQVVVVREAQDMKDFDKLEHYAEQPLPSTLLVVNYKNKGPDKRKKAYKAFERNGIVFESKKLFDDQLPGWITTYAAGRKYRIEPKASALLAEFLGSDLSRIANELEKLFIAIGEGTRTVTPDHVEQHIGISKDYNQFELQNALAEGNALKAQRIVNHFAAHERAYPPVLIFGSLYFFFTKILMIHQLQDKSRQNVASRLQVSNFFVPGYLTAARRYSPAKVASAIAILRDYDMRSKGYGGVTTPPGELLRELTYQLLHL